MNRYLDFENDIEKIDNQIIKLDVNDSEFIVKKNKLKEKKK